MPLSFFAREHFKRHMFFCLETARHSKGAKLEPSVGMSADAARRSACATTVLTEN